MESMTSNLTQEKKKQRTISLCFFGGAKDVFIKKRFVKFQPACQKSSLDKAGTPVRKSLQSDLSYRLKSFLPCVLKGFFCFGFFFLYIYIFNALQ